MAVHLLAGTPESNGNPDAGRAVYQKSCRACHGATGEVKSRTDEQLARDIAGGTRQKKPIKPLTEKQMKDVIAFVRTMVRK